jgi:hypothetical protein
MTKFTADSTHGSFLEFRQGQMRSQAPCPKALIDHEVSREIMSSLESVLKGSGYVIEHRTGDSEDPISDVIRIEVGTEESPYEIDVIAGIRGRLRACCSERASFASRSWISRSQDRKI